MTSVLAKPFIKIHTSAVRRVKVANGPIADHIAKHEAAGTDLAQGIWREYFDLQRRLIPYRKAKLQEEWAHFVGGGAPLLRMSYKDVIVYFRFAVRLTFVYMFGVILGRGTIMPPLEPTSPFIQQLPYNNPNWTDPLATRALSLPIPAATLGKKKSNDDHDHGSHH